MDVRYQRAFTASETLSTVPIGHKTLSAVPTVHYQPSPARERYYDMQAKLLAEKNVEMDKDKLWKAIPQVKLEDEAYHERNI